jgi:hypothetical protein
VGYGGCVVDRWREIDKEACEEEWFVDLDVDNVMTTLEGLRRVTLELQHAGLADEMGNSHIV